MAKKSAQSRILPVAKQQSPAAVKTPNVSYVRPELAQLNIQYSMIRDVLSGEHQVKMKKDLYLPRPNAEDKSSANQARYTAYVTRANFVNFTKRTMAGLIGQVFLRDPVVEIPTMLDYLKSDMTGSGITLDQLASMMVAKNLAFGRIGILVDYPDTDIPATVAAIQTGQIRPSVLLYDAWQVINWRTVVVNGRELLSLVVIYESIIDSDDGFETTFKDQWRVLRLETTLDGDGETVLTPEHFYVVDLYERTIDGITSNVTYMPKGADNVRLNEIPFKFIGANNNDTRPDDPPMYDLASVNLAHYRNSADYEEAAFIVGQPTPYFTGLTEDWVKNVLEGKVYLGSRQAIPLPSGSQAGLIQAQGNGLIKEAMEMKERQMVALGARLVQQRLVQRTATEANQEEASQNSVLANVANNVEIGIVWALTWCAKFTGVSIADTVDGDGDAISYQLNTQFDLTALDPAELAQLILAWQGGGLTTTEFRASLRRAGYAMLDDDAFAAQKKVEATDGTAPVPATPPSGGNKVDKNGKPIANAPPAA
jgi:hypothetical protein